MPQKKKTLCIIQFIHSITLTTQQKKRQEWMKIKRVRTNKAELILKFNGKVFYLLFFNSDAVAITATIAVFFYIFCADTSLRLSKWVGLKYMRKTALWQRENCWTRIWQLPSNQQFAWVIFYFFLFLCFVCQQFFFSSVSHHPD